MSILSLAVKTKPKTGRSRQHLEGDRGTPLTIERHKVATDELEAACTHLSEMEAAIPDERSEGGSFCYEVEIVETDDPRWTAANIRYTDCANEQDAIAVEMLKAKPTTLAGLQAMLTYAYQHVAEGNLWPESEYIEDRIGIYEDEGPRKRCFSRDWNFYLLRNLAETVRGLGV